MNGINEQKQRPVGLLKNVLMMILMLHSGLLLSDAVYGNNVRINGEPVVQLNSTSDSLSLTFTLSWDNSWRDDFNWDAVWLFVKYKREGSQDAWSHLYLGGSQVGTANLEIDPGNTGSQIVGAFVYPKHKGTFHIAGEQVKLQAPLNGLSASDLTEGKIYFAVTGIEMVLIPYGAYYLGDSISYNSLATVTGASVFMYKEETSKIWVKGGNTVSLLNTYPKGYKGFYVMKYELSQEQYVNFLNMLSYAQQKSRIGNNLDNLERGDYVFGDPTQPSCRNGIAVFSNKGTSQPVVFGNNLNPAEPFFAEDDGQTLACNYMTGADMLAYLDWSGLRPLSELEYEKMSRTPNRVTPGEYAWNSTVIHSLGGQSGLSSSTVGTENEVPLSLSTNVNSGTPSFGPVRCGSFGSSTSTQQESGSSFYGVMELSGNLGEMYYSVTGGSALNTSSLANEYHGDGLIDNSGNYNVGSYWNRSSDVTAFLVRGGSFASGDSLLRVSDRSIEKGYDNTGRDSTVTFRGGRSIGKSIDPGEITCDATCPGLVTVKSVQEAAADCDLSYLWYVKRPGTSDYELIPGETGSELEDFEVESVGTSATVTYTFRRKAVALTGEGNADFDVILTNVFWKLNVDSVYLDVCGKTEGVKVLQGTSGATYKWSYHGTILSILDFYIPIHAHFGNAQGQYTVECTFSLNTCSDSKHIIVQKEEVPQQIFTTCGSNVSDCEGNIYPTVQIGKQCWMGKNMNIGSFRTTGSTGRWLYTKAGIQKWCKDNVESNCNVYGGLYEWWEAVCGGKCVYLTETQALNAYVANETDLLVYGAKPATVAGKIQGICPEGWHIPTVQEVNVAIALPDIGNLFIPAGGNCWSYRNGSFNYPQTGFWTSQSYGAGRAHMAWTMTPGNPETLQIGGYGATFVSHTNYYDYGHYVRCIKD